MFCSRKVSLGKPGDARQVADEMASSALLTGERLALAAEANFRLSKH